MVEHVHLKDSLVHIHRTHLELLALDDLVISDLVNRLCEGLLESCILKLLLDLCLVLADLSDDLIYSIVEGN